MLTNKKRKSELKERAFIFNNLKLLWEKSLIGKQFSRKDQGIFDRL